MLFQRNDLKVARNGFVIFNTNSLMDRYYHTSSFVSLRVVSNKCPIIYCSTICDNFSDIKIYYSNTIASWKHSIFHLYVPETLKRIMRPLSFIIELQLAYQYSSFRKVLKNLYCRFRATLNYCKIMFDTTFKKVNEKLW